jgi:hypothetical protein
MSKTTYLFPSQNIYNNTWLSKVIQVFAIKVFKRTPSTLFVLNLSYTKTFVVVINIEKILSYC